MIRREFGPAIVPGREFGPAIVPVWRGFVVYRGRRHGHSSSQCLHWVQVFALDIRRLTVSALVIL